MKVDVILGLQWGDEGISTAPFCAICALRIRVSMSAIGSVMLIALSLPTGLGHARHFAAHGHFA